MSPPAGAEAVETSPRLASAATFALLTRGLLLVFGIAQGMLLGRGLGPAGLGRYSAALVDVNLLVALFSLGLPGALAVLRSESAEPARLSALRRIARSRGVLLVGLLVLAGLGLRFFPRWLDRTPLVCVIIGCGVLVQYVRDVENSLLWGEQRFSTQNRVNLIAQALLFGGLLLLVLLHRLQPETALALQISSTLLWTCAAVILRPAALPQQARASSHDTTADLALRRRALEIGLRNYFSLLLDLLVLRVDVYLIQELLPAAQMERQLGLYQAGVRVAELVLMLPGTLNALLFAKAAASEDVAQAALASAKLSLWLGLLALGGMALCGQPLLLLFFGARFAGSFAPCLWVLLGCAAMCFSGPLAGTLQGAAGYPRSVMWAQGVALIVNIIANFYLLPRYGIVGAAFASALTYTVSAMWIAAAFAKRFGLSIGSLLRVEAPWTLLRQLRSA